MWVTRNPISFWWSNSSIFIQKVWVCYNILWSSLNCLSMTVHWCVTQGMSWVALLGECPMIRLKSVVQRCSMTIWIILIWWCMLNKYKRLDFSESLRMLRGKSLIKVVPITVVLILNTRQDSARGSPIKFLLCSLRLMMIGFLTLSSKREEFEIHQARILLVESMVKSMWVNV